jgi:hypothetical protein
MNDLEMVPAVASAVLRRESNGELIFTFRDAVEVIQACTSSRIAVLGIEVFPGLNVSTYDLHVKDPAKEEFWTGYVGTNNALAEDFVRRNPAPSTSECILTTASWREFCEIKRQNK